MKKILVIGSNGQLASELKFLSSEFQEFEFTFSGQNEVDISKIDTVKKLIDFHNPNFIINCAAYTAVDKAEMDIERAYEINELGVKNLAKSAKEVNAMLIHISTDCVFDGEKIGGYVETDKTNPLSVYGKSKQKGEEAIQVIDGNYVIIRTSWVYSLFGNNFVKTIIRLGTEKESINVVSDQIGSPTYCRDLAQFILENIYKFKSHSKSIYHYANEGEISWCEFATEIMKLKNLKCQVNPIPTSQYPTPAIRPKNCFLDKTKVKKDFGIKIPHWNESLKKCIDLL